MPRYDNIPEIAPNLDGSGLRVGVVMCRFNLDVCEGLLSACTAELLRLGVAADAITIATVPGALEAPLTLQVMAKSGRFDALVALGAVIRGETYHFELVSNEQGAGINRVSLDTGRENVVVISRHSTAFSPPKTTTRPSPACRSRVPTAPRPLSRWPAS